MNSEIDKMISGGIFGPKMSGKTTLAKKLSVYFYTHKKVWTIVLDPNDDEIWPQCAKRFHDQAEFEACIYNNKNCLVMIDEASTMIAREKEHTKLFTRLTHTNAHRLLIIGHSGTNLLPEQRQQLDQVFLFRQSERAAKIWAEDFTRDAFLESAKLNQYEYLHGGLWIPVQKKLLTKPAWIDELTNRKLKIKA